MIVSNRAWLAFSGPAAGPPGPGGREAYRAEQLASDPGVAQRLLESIQRVRRGDLAEAPSRSAGFARGWFASSTALHHSS